MKNDLNKMVLLYIVIGMWIGMVLTYIQWYRPMSEKIKNLEEGMHDCIKAGLSGSKPDEEEME